MLEGRAGNGVGTAMLEGPAGDGVVMVIDDTEPETALLVEAPPDGHCEMTFIADDGVEQTIRFRHLTVRRLVDNAGRDVLHPG